MADVTISQLSPTTNVTGNLLVPTSNGSTTTSLSLNQIRNFTNIVAIGGDSTQTLSNGYKLHSFTSTGTQNFTVTNGGQIEYFLVGGGGSGGGRCGGGGGGGGIITGIALLPAGIYSVTVGAGGASVVGDPGCTGSGFQQGLNGGSSSIFKANTVNIIALGGGGGGTMNTNGNSGGCGGGGGGYVGNAGGSATVDNSNTAIFRSYGNNGGVACVQSGPVCGNGRAGGGGGGAGSAGSAAVPALGGNGGSGVSSNFSGTSITYAGGGGGGNDGCCGGTAGTGGSGGGGNAGNPGAAGTDNLGGGGGGGVNTASGKGGSGIVYIRYIA